tara:strand:- start:3421 stop:3690 length:270 start_codon:yes stop_codon:yes gene_type:complete
MSRYKNSRIKVENNKSYYKTTIFDKIPKSDSDIYVITQFGDRLDLLAHQFYGDTSLWWYIARANDLNTMIVPENIQLRIPGSTQYAKGK